MYILNYIYVYSYHHISQVTTTFQHMFFSHQGARLEKNNVQNWFRWAIQTHCNCRSLIKDRLTSLVPETPSCMQWCLSSSLSRWHGNIHSHNSKHEKKHSPSVLEFTNSEYWRTFIDQEWSTPVLSRGRVSSMVDLRQTPVTSERLQCSDSILPWSTGWICPGMRGKRTSSPVSGKNTDSP